MDRDVVDVAPAGEWRLVLRFKDGTEGELDFAPLLSFKGVFEPLRDPVEFAKVAVNRDIGTICWPSGADFDPDVLYCRITGASLPGQP
ncbi:MAG: DUF2442 domain-containing protein [Magnetospirillum sp.]|nr:DUF2442 domain-containing protein [Magnetospirillum sp.]